MFKEHRSFIPELDFTDLSFSVLGMVKHTQERFEKIQSSIEGHKVIEGAHKNWNNVSFCQSLSKDAAPQYTVNQLLSTFPANFRTFTDEYCRGSMVEEYFLAVNRQGTTGLDTSYQETIGVQAKRFEEKVGQTHRRQQRATVETWNSERLDPWLAEVCNNPTIPVGTKLVWCSPPGHKIEGYHGVSRHHHSFIWVYEKKLDLDGRPMMTMTQFRCWPSLKQLEDIQGTLRSYQKPTGLLENTEMPNLTRRNAVIHSFIELPPDVDLKHIEDTIYEKEDTWAINSKDMPDLSQKQVSTFSKYREQLLNSFLIPLYRQVLETTPQLQEGYDSPFWRSPEYAAVIHQLDVGFAVAWQHLLKYIETGVPQGIDFTYKSPQPSELRELVAIKLRDDRGELTRIERARFNHIAPQLLSAGSKLLSVGQCGVGTLIPLNLIESFNLFSIFDKFQSLSQLTKYDVAQLSVGEKHLFRTQVLNQYKPLTLKNAFGRTQKYWVKQEYYQEYVDGVYEGEPGKFYGECDISLDTGEDAFVLTDAKYQELFQAATTLNSSHEALNRSEQKQLQRAKTPGEKIDIREQFKKERQLLRHRVSFLQWLNDDFEYRFDDHYNDSLIRV